MRLFEGCFLGWDKELGNRDGKCCCNCKYRATTYSADRGEGYCCVVQLPDRPKVLLITEHGMCEMHKPKNET